MNPWTSPLPKVVSDQHRPPRLLERPGDNLGRRGGAAVDQHRHRQTVGDVAVHRPVDLLVPAGAGVGADDKGARFEEDVGRPVALAEQAAGVVAQVEDEPRRPVLGALQEGIDGGADIVGGPGIEIEHADVDYVAVGEAGEGHVDERDTLAGESDRDRVAGHRPVDPDAHVGAGPTPEQGAGLGRGEPGEGHGIGADQDVAGEQPDAARRSVLAHRHDQQSAVVGDDGHADAAVGTGEFLAHAVEVGAVDVARVAVEQVEHGAAAGLGQARAVDRLHPA